MGLVGLCGNLRLLATLVFSLYSVVQLALLVLNVLVVTSTLASVEAALHHLDQDAGLLGDDVLYNTAREIILRVCSIKQVRKLRWSVALVILQNPALLNYINQFSCSRVSVLRSSH